MPRLVWLIGLIIVFAIGVATGGAFRERPSEDRDAKGLDGTVTRLEHEVARLQGQLHAAEARLEAIRHRVPSATNGAGHPADRAVTGAGTAASTVAAVLQAPPPAPTAQGESRVAGGSAPAVPSAPAAGNASVEAALERFYRFVDETGGIGRPGAWRQTRELLEDLRAMGEAGAEALRRVLGASTSSEERRSAAVLLGSLKDPHAVPILQHVAETETDLLLRRAAAQALRRLEVPEAIPALETLLTRPGEDRFVRMSAAHGLAQLGQPAGVTGLVQIFEESTGDGRGREMAFRTLTSLNDERSLPFMRELVTSSAEVSYRLQAIRFVGAQGDQQALAALQRVMTSRTEQPSIREAAAQAHAAITRR